MSDKVVGVVLAAAGQSRRMGTGESKQFMLLQGRPVLAWSLQFFVSVPHVREIVVVCTPEHMKECASLVHAVHGGKSPSIRVVAGGAERQDSVLAGLKELRLQEGLVAVHDGARPLLGRDMFSRLLEALDQGYQGAVPGVPVVDTIKQVDPGGQVVQTLPRHQLMAIQTPQVFELAVLRACYERALEDGYYGTDDASLLERCGHKVAVVAGDPANIKITRPVDLVLADYYLERKKEKC